MQYFPDFIDQQIQKFDETHNPAITTRKNILELSSPSVEKIGDAYYWIAGSAEVHLLNHERNEENKFYARKLSPDEIAQLPVEIVYVGQENLIFLDDEEKAFTILVSIIEKMNSMQDPKFVSFPLGKFGFSSHQTLHHDLLRPRIVYTQIFMTIEQPLLLLGGSILTWLFNYFI